MVETLPALPLNLEEIGARAAELARTSRSAATECAYRSDWADFSTWCDLAGLVGLPGEATTVGAYLSARAAPRAWKPGSIRTTASCQRDQAGAGPASSIARNRPAG
jgi:hypothetical protein